MYKRLAATCLVFSSLFVTVPLVTTPAEAQCSGDGLRRQIRVINRSRSETVVSIHAVPPSMGRPMRSDPDIIPGFTIGPGQSASVTVDNCQRACVFNILFTTNSKRPDWIIYNKNVCRGGTVTVGGN
jgi:hypothetical protein